MNLTFSPVAAILAGLLLSQQVSASESTSAVLSGQGTSSAAEKAASSAPEPKTVTAADAPTMAAVSEKTPVPASAPAQVFTPEQEARIGELAKGYLMDHPEILIDVSQKLQIWQREQQIQAMTTAVLSHQDELLNDKSTPSRGPADAKVVLVEFFDYQCSVCVRQAPVIENLMKDNPQVRYVFKEWPVFASRWENSMTAAQTGLQIWQQKGADAYLAYHNALFASGHDEGKLTAQDIRRAAAGAGKLKGDKSATLGTLAQTDGLAQTLGFRGTPGLIVMAASGATARTVTVIPGGAGPEVLQAAIDRAGGE